LFTIVDYGMGNVGSIQNMLTRLGFRSVMTADPAALGQATRIVLPGVGAFDHAVGRLRELGLFDALNERVLRDRVPVLGICLGMQLLSGGSEEGSLPGFGWIPARTVRFPAGSEAFRDLRLPHMGWNTVAIRRPNPLLREWPDGPRFYFVHSYHVACEDDADVLATATYGIEFHAAVNRGNIWGTQFHPEKSHKFGLDVLKRFAGLGSGEAA